MRLGGIFVAARGGKISLCGCILKPSNSKDVPRCRYSERALQLGSSKVVKENYVQGGWPKRDTARAFRTHFFYTLQHRNFPLCDFSQFSRQDVSIALEVRSREGGKHMD